MSTPQAIGLLGLDNDRLKKDAAEAIGLYEKVGSALTKLESLKASPGSLLDLTNKNKQLAAANDQLVKSYDDLSRKVDELNKKLQEGVNKSNATANAAKSTAEGVNAQVSAYKALVAMQKEAEDTARSLALQYGEESEQARDAAKANIELKTKIEEAKKAAQSVPVVGNTQNVGSLSSNQSQFFETLAKEGEQADDNTKKLASYTAQLEEVKKRQRELSKVVAENAATSERLSLARAALLKEENDLKNAISDTKSEMANEKKIADELTNDYLQLGKAYNDAAIKAKSYALTLGLQHPVTLQAIKDAKSMHDVLLTVDQAVGDSRRNVGSYASAFDGLGFSMTQIARELPTLTMGDLANGVQMFSLAISNNLPQVQDEIRKARLEIKALLAEGQATPSLFQRITASLFSAQVGFAVLITVITAVLPKIIDYAEKTFSAARANEELTKKQTALNKAIEETGNQYDNIETKRQENIDESIAKEQNAIGLLKERGAQQQKLLEQEIEIAKKRAEDAKKGIPGQEEAGIEELRKENSAKVQMLNEYAGAYSDISEELAKTTDEDEQKKLQIQKDAFASLISLTNQQYDEINGIIDNYYKTQQEEAIANAKLQKFIADEERKRILSNVELQVSRTKTLNESILNDTRTTLEARLNAVKSITDAEIKLAAAQRNNVLNNPESSDVDRLIALDKYNTTRLATIKSRDQREFDINEEFRKRDIEADTLYYDTKLKQDKEYYDKASNNPNLSLTQQLQALQASQEIQKQILEIDHAAKEELLKNTYRTQAELEADEAEYQANITALTQKGAEERLAFIKSYNERVQQETKAAQSGLRNAIQSVYLSDAETTEQYAADVAALDQSLAQKEISLRKYTSQRQQLDDEYNTYSLASQLAKDRNELANVQHTEAEKYALRQKIAEEEIALIEKVSDAQKEAAKELADSEREFLGSILDLGQSIGDASFQRKIDNYEQLKQASDDYYSREIENIANAARIGSITDQEAADRTTILRAEQEEANKQYDRKQREQKIKQARFDKAVQIAEATATGVQTSIALFAKAAEAKAQAALLASNPLTAAYAPIALAAAASITANAIISTATTAALIAKIALTPIPTYKDGLKGGKGAHIGIYGEAGPELVEKPGFAPFIANRATLDFLPPDTRITPMTSAEIDRNLNNAMLSQTANMLMAKYYADKNQQKSEADFKKQMEFNTKQLIKAISKIQKAPIVNITNSSEFEKWKQKRINW